MTASSSPFASGTALALDATGPQSINLETTPMHPKTFPILAIAATTAFAGPKFTFDDGKRSLEIQQAYQFWSATTFDPIHTPDADARMDVFVRRARISLKGLAYPNLYYQFMFAADNLGKDSLTGVGGGPQVPAVSLFQAVDAAAWYTAFDDLLVVSAGLIRPHLNRELFASYSNVPSLDFANTYGYVRDHYTTRNTARETGLSVSSVWYDTTARWGASVDLGAFDNSWNRSATAATPTVGAKWSPLLTGRLSLNLGDRENKGWQMVSNNSTRSKGWGAALGLFGAYKGETETKVRKDSSTVSGKKVYSYAWLGGSESSDIWGADLLAWAFGATVQAEWVELGTGFGDSAREAMPGTFRTDRVADHAVNVRATYALPLEGFGTLEPAAAWTRFLADDLSPRYKGGRDEIVDLGLNWLLDGNKAKLSLHYLNNTGSASTSFTSGQNKAGYSQRNDSYVLGLQLQI